jgi:hypothetical protein
MLIADEELAARYAQHSACSSKKRRLAARPREQGNLTRSINKIQA